MNGLVNLKYGEQVVRVVTDAKGDIWWAARDVCEVLDIKDVSDAVERLDSDERGSTPIADAWGRPQEMLAVNEFGLYSLVMGSRKPEAKLFKRWVLHEVLPSIRRTGRYEVSEPAPLPAPAPAREHAEVSEHLVRIWVALRDSEGWLSSVELAHRCAVAPRTARAHTKYLVELGLVDMLETFPHHLHRLSPEAAKRNVAAYQRLQLIASVMESRRPRLPSLT